MGGIGVLAFDIVTGICVLVYDAANGFSKETYSIYRPHIAGKFFYKHGAFFQCLLYGGTATASFWAAIQAGRRVCIFWKIGAAISFLFVHNGAEAGKFFQILCLVKTCITAFGAVHILWRTCAVIASYKTKAYLQRGVS